MVNKSKSEYKKTADDSKNKGGKQDKIKPKFRERTGQIILDEEERDGLFKEVIASFPNTIDGQIAQCKWLVKNLENPRDRLFNRLTELQLQARYLAKLDGCPTDLSLIHI